MSGRPGAPLARGPVDTDRWRVRFERRRGTPPGPAKPLRGSSFDRSWWRASSSRKPPSARSCATRANALDDLASRVGGLRWLRARIGLAHRIRRRNQYVPAHKLGHIFRSWNATLGALARIRSSVRNGFFFAFLPHESRSPPTRFARAASRGFGSRSRHAQASEMSPEHAHSEDVSSLGASISTSARSQWLECVRVLHPLEPHPHVCGGRQQARSLTRHAGLADPHREGLEQAVASQGIDLRRPISRIDSEGDPPDSAHDALRASECSQARHSDSRWATGPLLVGSLLSLLARVRPGAPAATTSTCRLAAVDSDHVPRILARVSLRAPGTARARGSVLRGST